MELEKTKCVTKIYLIPYLSLYMMWSRNVLSTSRSICLMSGDVLQPMFSLPTAVEQAP